MQNLQCNCTRVRPQEEQQILTISLSLFPICATKCVCVCLCLFVGVFVSMSSALVQMCLCVSVCPTYQLDRKHYLQIVKCKHTLYDIHTPYICYTTVKFWPSSSEDELVAWAPNHPHLVCGLALKVHF